METKAKSNIGSGISKSSSRPIKVYVDQEGEYWLCDAQVDPTSGDFQSQGCVAHSDIHMAEGG